MLYQFSDINVFNEFVTPTKELFLRWRIDFLESNNLENYNILFMGNCAETLFGKSKIPTTDVDIILSGNHISYLHLSNTLKSAFTIGLRYNLLIDIFHSSVDVFKNDIWNDYQQIRFYKEIIDNNNISFPIEHNGMEKLPHDLYRFYKKDDTNKSLNKYLNRIQSGDYLSLKYDLKTMQLISFN